MNDKKSIIEMAMGAISERVDYEMSKIIDNILDVNTRASRKRTLTLTLEILPDDERKTLSVRALAKSKLEPTNPVATSLYITNDVNGELTAVEMTPQLPGQFDLNNQEQKEPYILKLA